MSFFYHGPRIKPPYANKIIGSRPFTSITIIFIIGFLFCSCITHSQDLSKENHSSSVLSTEELNNESGLGDLAKSIDDIKVFDIGFYPKKNLFDVCSKTGGFYLKKGYSSTTSTSRFCVVVIDVTDMDCITISGFPSTGSTYSAYLGSADKTDFKEIAWAVKNNNGTHYLDSKYQYLGICWDNSDAPPKMQIERGSVQTEYEPFQLVKKSTVIDNIYSEISEINHHLSNELKTISNQPMVFAIIDDDTVSVESVKKFHDICVANDVVGGYAAMAKNLERTPGIIPLLQQYEEEGFGVYLHCYIQGSFWQIKNRDNIADLKKSEADLCKGLRLLNQWGFFDAHTVWVVPGGMWQDEKSIIVKSMGVKHGFKYIINADSKEFLSMKYGPKNNRYDIPRFSFSSSKDDDGSNLTYLKKKIDDCVAMNASMILMTHTCMWDKEDSSEQENRFHQIVQYALSKGMINMNPLQLLEMKYPFYLYHEMREATGSTLAQKPLNDPSSP